MPSSLKPSSTQSEDFVYFKQHVAKLFHKANWIVETAKTNQPGYDLVFKKTIKLVLNLLQKSTASCISMSVYPHSYLMKFINNELLQEFY